MFVGENWYLGFIFCISFGLLVSTLLPSKKIATFTKKYFSVGGIVTILAICFLGLLTVHVILPKMEKDAVTKIQVIKVQHVSKTTRKQATTPKTSKHVEMVGPKQPKPTEFKETTHGSPGTGEDGNGNSGSVALTTGDQNLENRSKQVPAIGPDEPPTGPKDPPILSEDSATAPRGVNGSINAPLPEYNERIERNNPLFENLIYYQEFCDASQQCHVDWCDESHNAFQIIRIQDYYSRTTLACK